jgi:hypothetical protein
LNPVCQIFKGKGNKSMPRHYLPRDIDLQQEMAVMKSQTDEVVRGVLGQGKNSLVEKSIKSVRQLFKKRQKVQQEAGL